MGSLVLAGATSGSTTIQPTDAVTATVTLPSTGGTLQTSGAGFTTNGVAYATSTSALATGSALTFDGSNLAASGKITAGLKGSTFTTIDQQAIIANTTWSGANPRVLIYLTKSGSGSGGLGIDASNDVTVFDTSGTGRLTANSTGVNVTGSTGLTFNTSNAGIVFNNSGALTNSTFNDYEVGTYTPSVYNISVTGTTTITGAYTKIGRIVFFQVSLANTGTIAWGVSALITLPFNGTANFGAINMWLNSNQGAYNSNQAGTQNNIGESPFGRFFIGSFTTTAAGQILQFGGFYQATS